MNVQHDPADDDIELTDEQVRLFANERVAWDRSESTPFTHQAKLSRNLIAVKAELREHMWWERTAVELQRQRNRLNELVEKIRIHALDNDAAGIVELIRSFDGRTEMTAERASQKHPGYDGA